MKDHSVITALVDLVPVALFAAAGVVLMLNKNGLTELKLHGG